MDPVQWCKDRLWVPHNPISASLLFVAKEQQMPILALRAVHSELAQIAELSHEPGLAHSKLNWWREAFMQQHTHPALEALDVLKVREKLPMPQVMALCDAIEQSLEAPRYETNERAWQSCQALGGVALELEVQMLSATPPSGASVEAIQDLGAANYWLRLVRDIGADARQGRWFVPLEMQARHQINRQQVVDGVGGLDWDGFIGALVSEATNRLIRAEAQLHAALGPGMVHAMITAALDQRLAKQLTRAPSRLLRERILPSHTGNVWAAWRQARRCQSRLRSGR